MLTISASRSTAVEVTTADETVIIRQNVWVAVDGTRTAVDVTASGVDLYNYGNLLGFRGLSVGSTSTRGSLYNAESGSIIGSYIAVDSGGASAGISNRGDIFSDSLGVYVSGDASYLSNSASGSIEGIGVAGISWRGDGGYLLNHGQISGGSTGISASGANLSIVNHGDISGGRAGVLLENDGSLVRNTGNISSGGSGIILDQTGLTGGVHNSGNIDADIGVRLRFGSYGRIVNSGTIDARLAISTDGQATDAAIDFINSGAVTGALQLGRGVDTVRNTGSIAGEIRLDAGSDLFNGRGGSVSEAVYGGTGNDRLFAGSGDTVYGEGGDDILRAYGTGSALGGGRGADQLFASGGDDIFIYRSALESTFVVTDRDVIRGFDRAHDRIDLEVVDASSAPSGNQEFRFIGSQAFSGEAGELRIGKSGPNAVILADVDGDQVADLAIILAGLGSQIALFSSEDFVL